MNQPFDIAVIGGGAAGCAAAEEAARLGSRVVLIERNRLLGGASWLRGRLPARLLQEVAARVARQTPAARNTDAALVELSKLLLDLDARRRAHSQQLSESLAQHRVMRLHARAQLLSDGHINLTTVRGEQHRIVARTTILATGDRAVSIPGARIDHELILDSGSALSAVYLPRTLAVVGQGPAAVEMAGLFAALGTATTLIVSEDTLLAGSDASLRDAFVSSFKAMGGEVLWHHTVVSTGKDGKGGARCTVRRRTSGEERTFDVDRLIVATHREATGRSLSLERVGIQRTSTGMLKVDDRFETTARGIFAVGAAVGAGTSPARVAHQAQQAVRNAVGLNDNQSPETTSEDDFVDAILTVPELAQLGKAEREVPHALVATVFDGGVGLKLVATADRRMVGLHAWGTAAEARLDALTEVVASGWSLRQLASDRADDPAFEHVRQAAATLLTKRRPIEDLVLDPDDLLAGIIPMPPGTSAA